MNDILFKANKANDCERRDSKFTCIYILSIIAFTVLLSRDIKGIIYPMLSSKNIISKNP